MPVGLPHFGSAGSIGRISISVTLLYMFVCIILPSGDVLGLQVKQLLAFSAFFFTLLFIRWHAHASRWAISYFGGVAGFLLFFGLIALINGVPGESTVSHAIAIMSTVILPGLFLIFGVYSASFVRIFLAYFCLFAAIHAAIKVIVFLLVVNSVITLDDYVAFNVDVFNYEPIRLELDGGFARIHTPSDYVLPIALLVAMRSLWSFGFSGFFALSFAVVLMIFAVVVSYSRFLWAYTAIVIFLELSRSRFFRPLILFIVLPGALWLMTDSDFVRERFLGENAADSDLLRPIMNSRLWDLFWVNPVVGSGLGGYDVHFVRFPTLPWNYELQWLATLAQFGVFGLVIIVGFVAGFALRFMFVDRAGLDLAALVSYFTWLAVGFVNCFLLTSSASVVFAIHYAVLSGYLINSRSDRPS